MVHGKDTRPLKPGTRVRIPLGARTKGGAYPQNDRWLNGPPVTSPPRSIQLATGRGGFQTRKDDMSHFTVLVVLPPTSPSNIDQVLATAVAPFDENMEMDPPVKKYLEDAEDIYTTALEHFTAYPEDKPAGLDELNMADVLSAYDGTEVTEEPSSDGTRFLYFRWDTYNPDSKWDWYTIGGRWADKFPVLPAADRKGEPGYGRKGERSWINKNDIAKSGYVDAAAIGVIDFDRMRSEAGQDAGARYDRWTALTEGLPPARTFSTIRDEMISIYGDNTTAHEVARERYYEQPVIIEARKTDEFDRWFSEVLDEYGTDRETYVQRARDGAVPGYALLDHEGHWVSPGEMGWWGMSSDDEATREAYHIKVNAYLDELREKHPDMILVNVDMHI